MKMLFLALVLSVLPFQLQAETKPIVLGYCMIWSNPDLTQIRYENFTHLAYAFLETNPDGNVAFYKPEHAAQFVKLAHAKGVKALLSLGGSGSGEAFTSLMKDPKAVERYIEKVLSIVKEHGFDGLDVDWEHPRSQEDKQNQAQLIKKFRQGLPKNALISMAVTGTHWAAQWLDEKTLLPLVDFLNVMTYDMHGPWDEHAGYNSPLHATSEDTVDGRYFSFDAMMDYWTGQKHWPKEKLNVGIPLYGYGYAVTSWGEKPDGQSAHSSIAYRDIPGLLKDGWQRVWDGEACVPYLKKDGVQELITYDDPESVALKGEWTRKNGYRGIFFWEISQDRIDGDNALVVSARKGFLK